MWQVLRAGKPENDFWYSNLLSSCFRILLLALTKEDVKCVSSRTWKGWELTHLLPSQRSIYEPVGANRTLLKNDEKKSVGKIIFSQVFRKLWRTILQKPSPLQGAEGSSVSTCVLSLAEPVASEKLPILFHGKLCNLKQILILSKYIKNFFQISLMWNEMKIKILDNVLWNFFFHNFPSCCVNKSLSIFWKKLFLKRQMNIPLQKI